MKILEPKPLAITENYISSLEKIKKMETQTRNIESDKFSKYEDQQRQQRIANNQEKLTFNLADSKLTDLNMEIVANELEMNKVSEHYFYLLFKLLQCQKKKGNYFRQQNQ